MKILAIEKELPGASPDAFTQRILEEEAARAWTLYQDGVIRELYFRPDRREAVLVLEADGVEQARAALATLPLARERLIEFEIIPLAAYPGFERLFSRKK